MRPTLTADAYEAFLRAVDQNAHRVEVVLSTRDIVRLNMLFEAVYPMSLGGEPERRIERAIDPLANLLNQLGVEPGHLRGETRHGYTDAWLARSGIFPRAERSAA